MVYYSSSLRGQAIDSSWHTSNQNGIMPFSMPCYSYFSKLDTQNFGRNLGIKRGFDDTEPARQRYECHNCDTRFDDLTDTIFAGHHQPLKVWILCLYFMGLNVSNEQIAQELALNGSDAQQMTAQLREGIVKKQQSA